MIWSANNLLRWDTSLPLTGPNGDPSGPSIGPSTTNWSGQSGDSYSLCLDPVTGDVWNTALSGNAIKKYAPNGTFLGTFQHGFNSAQGCVVDSDGDVWVAHSLSNGATTVGHLNSTGAFLGNVALLGGNGPTGVAVDGNGKVWSANINSNSLSRIDPSLNGGVGGVDLTVDLGAGAGPYNYGDMTGSTLIAPPNFGSWTVVFDSGFAGKEWGGLTWSEAIPSDSTVTVEAASSTDGSTFSGFVAVSKGVALSIPDGQYLKVRVSFQRATTLETPILYDLTILCSV